VPPTNAPFTAVVRVRGAREQLQAFRERVRWLLVRDPDAESYTEHHGEESLEYRFELSKGVPFPVFATATSEFPGLRVEAEWRNEARAVTGRAVIERGQLLENSTEALGERALVVDVAVGAEGELLLALACRDEGDTIAGYAASAARHAFFRYTLRERRLRIAEDAGARWTHELRFDASGRLEAREPLDEPLGEALEPLEALAFDFAAQWLWYDEAPAEETVLERARFADYGYTVRGANLRSEALARLRKAGARQDGTLRYSNLGATEAAARAVLHSGWLEANSEA
jgi:hypothetical protein